MLAYPRTSAAVRRWSMSWNRPLPRSEGWTYWSPTPVFKSIVFALSQTTEDQWPLILDVNLTGAANSMRAVLPYFIKQNRGNIIALTSVERRMGDKILLVTPLRSRN